MKPNKKDTNLLRERFLIKFCKEKGWNPKELTTNQMLIVVKNQNYPK